MPGFPQGAPPNRQSSQGLGCTRPKAWASVLKGHVQDTLSKETPWRSVGDPRGRSWGLGRTAPAASLPFERRPRKCRAAVTVLGDRGGLTENHCHKSWQSSTGTTHLDVAAVVAAGRELDPAEGDGALEGHLDGRLFHAVLAVGPGCARDGTAAEVTLYWCRQGKGLDGGAAAGATAPRDHVGRPLFPQPPAGPLTLADAVLSRQESLLEQALQHRAHGGPVHQLQHEQVRLRREGLVKTAAGSLPCSGAPMLQAGSAHPVSPPRGEHRHLGAPSLRQSRDRPRTSWGAPGCPSLPR